MKMRVKVFLAIEYIVFLVLFFLFFQNIKETIPYIDVIYFTIVLFFAENISRMVYASYDVQISIILPILIPAMILLDPFLTGIIAMLGSIHIRSFRNFVWYQFIFNRTVFFMAASMGGLIFNISLRYFSSQYLIVPVLLGSLIYFLIDNGLVYLVIRLDTGKKESSLVLYYIQLFKSLVVSYFLGLIFYYSFVNYGRVFIILAIILIYILKDLMYSRIQQLNSFTQIVESFLKVIDSKDHYTEGHCERVGDYCRVLCQELGLNISKRERIVNMAKIHDIGKIYVKDSILKSADKLTPEEYEEMKRHSYYGYELLNDIDILKEDIKIILYHHERYDGTGYPEGKRGDEIPLGARILCICHAFDVMTTGREYKAAMNKAMVIQEIEECSGSHFDPLLARKMVELIKKGRFDDSFRYFNADERLPHQLKLNLDYFVFNGLEG